MEEAQIVDIETSHLSESMQHKLNTLWGNANEAKNFSIFRTPHNISESKKNIFVPSVISIGPFHRGQKHLQALEEQKWRFLQNFLSRKDHISLEICISEMKLIEKRTRSCYSEMSHLKSDAFVEMMLLDGCFVLEYFMKIYEGNWNSILEVGWNTYFIDRDLLLLENQIPFFIVEKLYELAGYNQEYIMRFVKFIACNLLPTDNILLASPAEIPNPLAEIPDPPAEIHHLTHLCYYYLVPNPDVLSSKPFDLTRMFSTNKIQRLLHRFRSTQNVSSMVIPSATELKEAGLKFKPKSNPKHMLDISFEYGVLKIPRLAITDDTKSVFANLLAFEQSRYGKENKPFTSFVAFLDNLVNTSNDVTILQRCGIIENWLGSEEELAHFINQVTEGNIVSVNHYLAELLFEVNRYIASHRMKSSWNRQQEKLFRDYFSSPWKVISLLAAFILLVLTCIQTFYAVYAYKYPPSS